MSKIDAMSALSLNARADRAYRAMFAAEQKLGHGSAAHAVAWTVFADAHAILAGETSPRAYSVDEMALALDYVEALCAGRKGRKGFDLSAAVLELARRPHTMFVEVRA